MIQAGDSGGGCLGGVVILGHRPHGVQQTGLELRLRNQHHHMNLRRKEILSYAEILWRI